MKPAAAISVQRSIAVNAPQDRAFDVFVDMTAWWPLATHTTGEPPARASIVEPRAGGRWYDVDMKGVENPIGSVLVYDRPSRLVLTWDLDQQYEYDPQMRTEIEVRFIPEAPDRTRIEFEHRGFEVFAEQAEAQRERYDGDDAWTSVLALYVKRVNADQQ